MPNKLTLRHFVRGGYYHVFNRGVAKQNIFFDQEDYEYFLHVLGNYLEPPRETKRRARRNFYKRVDILAFCLMPNHFHILLQQHEEKVVAAFIQSLLLRYVFYFNKKYKRVGHLFQDTYKARLIEDDIDLLHLTRYIHLNPQAITASVQHYAYSSLGAYIFQRKRFPWLTQHTVMEIFCGFFGLTGPRAKECYLKFMQSMPKQADSSPVPDDM